MNLHRRVVLHTGLAVRKTTRGPWRSFAAWDFDVEYVIDIDSLTILSLTIHRPLEKIGRRVVRAFCEHAHENSLELSAHDITSEQLGDARPFWYKMHFEPLPGDPWTFIWNRQIP